MLGNATMTTAVKNRFIRAGADPKYHCFQVVREANGAHKIRLAILENPPCPANILAPPDHVHASFSIPNVNSSTGTTEFMSGGKEIGQYFVNRGGPGGAIEFVIQSLCSSGGPVDYSGACDLEVTDSFVNRIIVH